jgi:hypothetical protein
MFFQIYCTNVKVKGKKWTFLLVIGYAFSGKAGFTEWYNHKTNGNNKIITLLPYP